MLIALIAASAARGGITSPTKCGATQAPCGPGNDLCHAAGYGDASPQYHVRDFSCGMNDPAAVIYDPVHAVYHDHWEDHLAIPNKQPGGYARGHAVSRDLVHWARMPVSLWNDRPYDDFAIFTGSATLVNGSVVQVYPGLCNSPKAGTGCPGGTNLAIAVPADPADPLQTNWTKDGVRGTLTGYVNPIANGTGRDPSTAWQTPSGEWRFDSYGSWVFGSMDFKKWYRIGQQKGWPTGECPSFFKLPKATSGSSAAPPSHAGAAAPTHVHKSSYGGRDFMVVGAYKSGAPKKLGTFQSNQKPQLVDAGAFYASKDFFDPVKQRRILWGWAKIAYGKWTRGQSWGSSSHTLPREITWNAELAQLCFAPLEEQSKLRGAVLGKLKPQPLLPAKPLSLLPKGTVGGNQSEAVLSFAMPTAAVNVTVALMVGAGKRGAAAVTLHFTPPATPSKTPWHAVSVSGTGVEATELRLAKTDSSIELRLFVDQVMAEAFWQGGRMASTLAAGPGCGADCGIVVTADAAGASLLSATAWAVNPIWVTPQDVLASPRSDGKEHGEGAAALMAERMHEEQRM